MNPIPDRLSIWELAHRWHGAIPSSSDDSSVTREIRDTLLALVDGVLYHGINVYLFTTRGSMSLGDRRLLDRCEVPSEIAAEDFKEIVETGVLDRKVLQNYSLMLEDVFEWCVHEGFEPPDFCIPEWAYGKLTPEPESVGAKARPDAEDKAKCQEIAARKWKENPQIRIARMAADRDIQIEGSGGLYKLQTLLAWLREVAPETVKGRPGRPRKDENTPPK